MSYQSTSPNAPLGLRLQHLAVSEGEISFIDQRQGPVILKTYSVTRKVLIVLAVLMCLDFGFAQAGTENVEGAYLATDKDHRIALFVENGKLFGRIEWVSRTGLKDVHNPDPKLRQRNVVGIVHIRDMRKADDGSWQGGSLYNPEDGDVYDARLWLDSSNHLIIRGKPRIPVLGSLLGALFGTIDYTRVR